MAKRTKIICTLGPATDDEGVLSRLLDAGMDVARLNFSHGTHAEHAERIARVRGRLARSFWTCAARRSGRASWPEAVQSRFGRGMGSC